MIGLAFAASLLQAGVKIEASGEIPADALDPLGDTVGGIGSGLIYDAASGVFLCQPDRGPGDGALAFRPRYVGVKMEPRGDQLHPKVVESVLYRDEQGRPMTGLTPDDPTAATPRMKDGRTCLDPEAIALAPDGTLYVSDEYGPYLYQFRRDGQMIRRIVLPEKFRPRTAAGVTEFTGRQPLAAGRNVNQGGEGMALLPDGKTAVLIFQSGLVEDGGRQSPTTRMLFLDLETEKPVAEYLYPFATTNLTTGEPLKPEQLSVNDLVALDAKRFLVLERDRIGRDGSIDHPIAAYKSVWLADVSRATDLLNSRTRELRPVEKQFLFNLAALVKDPRDLAAKWEGIAVMPPSDEKAVTLMMAADNDFLTPVIHDEGKTYPFPRTEEPVPTQFFQIRADLPAP